jgi:RNA polymerase sigma-70 factor, ECF subfamily
MGPISVTEPVGGRSPYCREVIDAAQRLQDDEAGLLRRVAAGDRAGPLDELYRRYEGRLYGLGMRLLGDPGLAEELVQETFVRLWRKADAFDAARGTAGAFIITIARRIAIDLWRRPSSRPFAPEVAEGRAGGDAVDQLLVGLTVRDALDALSAAHREVLELAYSGDLRQHEIATKLGIPLGTVKTRTYYALRALKLALEERGIDA